MKKYIEIEKTIKKHAKEVTFCEKCGKHLECAEDDLFEPYIEISSYAPRYHADDAGYLFEDYDFCEECWDKYLYNTVEDLSKDRMKFYKQ